MDKIKNIIFAKGRDSFKIGLIAYNFKDGDEILVPSYICESIINPILELNIKPIFYDQKNSLKPIWPDVKKKLTKKTKAILMINYFGFPIDIKKFIFISKKKKIFLIEDNCHGYDIYYCKKQLGYLGDFSFSSPKKFFDLFSGSILTIKKNRYKKLINNFEKEKISFFTIIIKKIFSKLNFLKKYINLILYKKKLSHILYKNNSSSKVKLIDDYSLKIFKYKNINLEKKRKLAKYFLIKNMLKQINIKPFFRKVPKGVTPLFFVAKVNNISQRKKLFHFLIKKNLHPFSWPQFPQLLEKNEKIKRIWKQIVCVSLK